MERYGAAFVRFKDPDGPELHKDSPRAAPAACGSTACLVAPPLRHPLCPYCKGLLCTFNILQWLSFWFSHLCVTQ